MGIMRKVFWRRTTGSGYQRLGNTSLTGERNRKKRADDSGSGTKRRRVWRIRISRKLRIIRKASPKKLLVWLRDAYVNMMMRLANSRVIRDSGYGDGVLRAPVGVKEYDEKMLVEIYKSILMAKSHLVHPDAPKLGLLADVSS